MTPDLPTLVDSTMISCYRGCPERFRNEFMLGLRPASLSVDLHAGACFASALETVYFNVHRNKTDFPTAIARAYAHFLEEWGDFEPLKDTPKTRDRMWEAVEEYFRKWGPLTDPVQPFIDRTGNPTFEFTFGIPLMPISSTPEEGGFPEHPSGQPFIYGGRFDMLGQWQGVPIVRDEKTTTSIGAAWADQWNLRSQFLGYCWACQQSGLPVDTVCIRGIGILKTKFHFVEAFKQYPQFLVEKWRGQLRFDLWRIRESWNRGYFDFNLADACTSYGGCAFRTLCESQNPERWYASYSKRNWNPLQKNPIAPGVAA